MLSLKAAGGLTLLVLALPVASCSTSSPNQSAPAKATDPRLGPGLPQALQCGTSEYYIPSAMNRLLDYSAELAAFAGLHSVSSCTEARALMTAYNAYRTAHPGFDRDQPVPRVYAGHPPPPPADAPSPMYLGPKLGGLGTTPIQIPPVVHFIFPQCPYVERDTPPVTTVDQCLKGTGIDAATLEASVAINAEAGIVKTPQEILGGLLSTCTATFIAKRWLITAAHCVLANMPPFTDGSGHALNTDGTSDAGGPRAWIENVRIDWAHGPGQGGGTGTGIELNAGQGFAGLFDGGVLTPGDGPNVAGELRTIVLAYVHPGFLGYMSGTSNLVDIAHDVALVYLPSSDDFFLPSDPNTGAAMAVSMIAPTMADTPSFFGWGGPTDNTLNEGNFPGMAFNVNTDGLTLNLNYASNWPGPFICAGDSGGPGVRQLAQGLLHPTAIVGTESSGGRAAPGNPCSGPGQSDILVGTYQLLASFIEPSLRDYEGDDFSCARLPEDTSNGVPTFAECWTKACAQDSDCAVANPNAVFGNDAGPSTRVTNADGSVTVFYCNNPGVTFKGQCLSYQEQNGSFGADDGGTE